MFSTNNIEINQEYPYHNHYHHYQLTPYPFGRGHSYKDLLKTPNIPIPWSVSSNTTNIERVRSAPIRSSHLPIFNSLPDQNVTNNHIDTMMSRTATLHRPFQFPNLVNGFERNPRHAAQTALYTRYTPAEWHKSCVDSYMESDTCRNYSERLRNEAVRVIRETDEHVFRGQRDASTRLGERLSDVTFWRNELTTELEKLHTEYSLLVDTKRKTERALADLEPPLHVAQECLYQREGRQGIEKVHDHVEKTLLIEVDNLRLSKEKLRVIINKQCEMLSNLRAAQHALESDIFFKENTLGIDSSCHKLTNFSHDIHYFNDIEKYDPTVSTITSWAQASSVTINKSQAERSLSVQLRSDTEALIKNVATCVWDSWSNSNNSLNKRSAEMCEAKNNTQFHLHQTIQEIYDIEKNIDYLQKAINEKANPLKVAQTRLEARAHRSGIEQCKDLAHVRLVQEVHDIQDSIVVLQHKLSNAELQHQQLLRTKSKLESDLKRKVNALFIDREKCLGMRRSFPANCLIKY